MNRGANLATWILHYRFFPVWFRKAECRLCFAVIRRSSCADHARFHYEKSEGWQKMVSGKPMSTSYRDITMNADHIVDSGWGTNWTGPK